MKFYDLLEAQPYQRNTFLAEAATYKLWEDVGHKIVEAKLTQDQIEQLFQQVEQGVTAAGGNRTLLGKGKDAASAVNNAWNQLKQKVYDSGPMANFAAAYDKQAEKLKQATGGDEGVFKYIKKYREFAEKHPIIQGFAYAALIAAAGISGAGLGGAAVLGLFKLTDQLLQGKDIRSAIYQGAKTGALAYGASKLGDFIKDKMTGPDATDATRTSRLINKPEDFSDASNFSGRLIAGEPVIPGQPLSQTQMAVMKMSMDMGNTYPPEIMAQYNAQLVKESYHNTKIALTESQVYIIIGKVVGQQKLNEGIMDTMRTFGKNLTTKVTVDKLLSAWKKAGSPDDSEEVAKVIKNAGVDDKVISDVYTNMKLPVPSGVSPETTAPTTPDETTPSTTDATTAQPVKTGTSTDKIINSVQSLLAQLKKVDPAVYSDTIKKISTGK